MRLVVWVYKYAHHPWVTPSPEETPVRDSARSTLVRSLVVAAAAGMALLGAAATASAQPTAPPVSGDPRAVAVPSNATTCLQAGLAGSDVTAQLTYTNDGTYVTVTGTDSVEVTGIVVKGGPAYNLYLRPALGPLPWTNLHSPLVPGGVPTISHWFACGVKAPPTTPTTTKTTTTTTRTTTTTTGSHTSTSGSSSSSGATTTSGAAATTTSAGRGSLPNTGFGNAWLIWLGVALLGGGALILAGPRLKKLLTKRD